MIGPSTRLAAKNKKTSKKDVVHETEAPRASCSGCTVKDSQMIKNISTRLAAIIEEVQSILGVQG